MVKFSLFWLMLTALFLATAHAQWDPHVQEDRQAMVHLFEWKYPDVATECENFLAPKGFGGVQVSPPHECVKAVNCEVQRPWWERYQPISYDISSRSGNEDDFKDMVERCNNVSVRIYVDAVINHMSKDWPAGTPTTGISSFDSGTESYPGVPYSRFDFNDASCFTPSGDIESYTSDVEQIRNCNLGGLKDLNLGTDYVRGKIVDYLNKLLGWGVAGFRVDAAKHMWPGDLAIIFSQLNNLNTDYFPAGSKAFILQEVIEGNNEAVHVTDYTGMGRVTEFKYGLSLGQAFRGGTQLKYLKNFGEGWAMLPRHESVVFIDNHDNQRGHGGGGDQILTFRQDKLYKMATAFMLGFPYGFARVMSSYYWPQDFVHGHDKNDWMGPPHDGSYNILSPTFNSDGSCELDWICEHRWRQIYNMVGFRSVAHGTDMNDWWDNGSNQIAFCRGNKGFLAINNDRWDLRENLQTCLSAGTYCDVISGSKEGSSCTGQSVDVDGNGMAYVEIPTSASDGVFAIHVGSKL